MTSTGDIVEWGKWQFEEFLSMATRNLCSDKGARVDETWPEDSEGTKKDWGCGPSQLNGELGYWALYLKRGTKGCIPIIGESRYSSM